MPEPASADTIPPKMKGLAVETASEATVDVNISPDWPATVRPDVPYSKDESRSGSNKRSQIGQYWRLELDWTAEQATWAARGIEAQLERALDQIDRLPTSGFYAGLGLIVVAAVLSALVGF